MHPGSLSVPPRRMSHCAEVCHWEARSGHVPPAPDIEEGQGTELREGLSPAEARPSEAPEGGN